MVLLWSFCFVCFVFLRGLYSLQFYLYTDLLVTGHKCHTACVRSGENLQEAVLSFHQVDSGSYTRVIRLGSRCPNPLSYPISPPAGFHKGWSSAQHVLWYAWRSPALAAAQVLRKQHGLCGICEGCLLFKSLLCLPRPIAGFLVPLRENWLLSMKL